MSDGVTCKGNDKQRGTWSDFGQEALVVASAGLSADPALTHPLRPLSDWLLCFPRPQPSLLSCGRIPRLSRIEEILEAVPPNILSMDRLRFPSCCLCTQDRVLAISGDPLFCWGDSFGDMWVLS